MTESSAPRESPILLTQSPHAPLPSARVLSYVTSAITPTHLRTVTSRILLIIAMIFMGIVLVTFGRLASLVFAVISDHSGFPPLNIFWEVLEYAKTPDWMMLLFLLAYTFSSGVAFLICAKHVRKGRSGACHVACLALVPVMLTLPVFAALSTFFAIMLGFPVVADDLRPAYFLLFLLTPAFALLTLLVIDLQGYIRWIAKNPITEKSPVPFLPGGAAKTTS